MCSTAAHAASVGFKQRTKRTHFQSRPAHGGASLQEDPLDGFASGLHVVQDRNLEGTSCVAGGGSLTKASSGRRMTCGEVGDTAGPPQKSPKWSPRNSMVPCCSEVCPEDGTSSAGPRRPALQLSDGCCGWWGPLPASPPSPIFPVAASWVRGPGLL